MATISVHNPNPGEVVYTEQGKVLPGHTSGISSTGDAVTKRLLAAGHLVSLAAKKEPATRMIKQKKADAVIAPKEDTKS